MAVELLALTGSQDEQHETHEDLGDARAGLLRPLGAMLAGGDLGVELPLERVPLEQHRIIRACGRPAAAGDYGDRVLESMASAPRPKRAEASAVELAGLAAMRVAMLTAPRWPDAGGPGSE
jgi:hypothetical protein